MRTLSFIIFSFILFTSCEKDEVTSSFVDHTVKPDIPANDTIDVNSDHIADFVIVYNEFATTDEPSSGGGITGSVIPLHFQQSKLLKEKDGGFLFLDVNDTIKKTSDTHSEWFEFGADLIRINRNLQNWDSNWSVLADNKPSYLLAYKLNIQDSEVIGWISLDFNTETSAITITDGDHTEENELIIIK